MKMAEVIAERGTCDRKQVGAVIARDGRIISVGYNGAPPGLPHCEENYHGWANYGHHPTEDASQYEERISREGCRNATHAEANALAFAARHGVPTDRADLFVTVAPCENCARLLIAAGVRRVWFKEAYRVSQGFDLLEAAGIKILQLTALPAGIE
jgi:dCMP deaminase